MFRGKLRSGSITRSTLTWHCTAVATYFFRSSPFSPSIGLHRHSFFCVRLFFTATKSLAADRPKMRRRSWSSWPLALGSWPCCNTTSSGEYQGREVYRTVSGPQKSARWFHTHNTGNLRTLAWVVIQCNGRCSIGRGNSGAQSSTKQTLRSEFLAIGEPFSTKASQFLYTIALTLVLSPRWIVYPPFPLQIVYPVGMNVCDEICQDQTRSIYSWLLGFSWPRWALITMLTLVGQSSRGTPVLYISGCARFLVFSWLANSSCELWAWIDIHSPHCLPPDSWGFDLNPFSSSRFL